MIAIALAIQAGIARVGFQDGTFVNAVLPAKRVHEFRLQSAA